MKTLITLMGLLCSLALLGQYDYEPSAEAPFGKPNPEGPKELLDWQPLIGTCDCQSVARISQTEWADTISMVWTFKYIMNGMGVQDETLKSDGINSGSIRQYSPDSSRWYVHYYSSNSPINQLPSWEGTKKENGKIILYRDSPAPNGMPGWYRLTFSNISDEGFDWAGEWVNKTETFTYPTWLIYCKRRD